MKQETVAELEAFEQEIGYRFRDKKLLTEALTHSSFANEGKKHLHNNERLEFLGDSVLSILVAEYLFTQFRNIPEGELTRLRASLVCEQALFEFSKSIHLGNYLLLGRGEENTGGRERPSIVSDAFEAVIAAIYLDGGIDAVKPFVLAFIPKDLSPKTGGSLSDYKTTLQEVIQQNREEKVEYSLTSESGPDHNKTFEVEIHLNSNVIGTGKGKSKKQAEQNAAREALKLMGYEA